MTQASVQESFYQSADGLRLFYRDYPAQNPDGGVPVLCLPGLTRNSLDFVELARHLRRHRRIITPDLRGRGRSQYDPDYSHYHPEQYASDIYDLMEHLDLPCVVIIGTSLGGLIAMTMNAERPDTIQAIVLNDVGPEIDAAGLARVLASAGQVPQADTWDEAVERLKQHYGVAYPDWTQQHWLRFAQATYLAQASGGLDIQLDRNVGVAVRQGMSGLRGDPWPLFDALAPKPVLVLRGALSDILSAEILQKMRTRKPDLHVAIVPNRGHAPFLDEPEALDAIQTFLEHL